jgi:hypothetical protein
MCVGGDHGYGLSSDRTVVHADAVYLGPSMFICHGPSPIRRAITRMVRPLISEIEPDVC